jgi:hypothetical protein
MYNHPPACMPARPLTRPPLPQVENRRFSHTGYGGSVAQLQQGPCLLASSSAGTSLATTWLAVRGWRGRALRARLGAGCCSSLLLAAALVSGGALLEPLLGASPQLRHRLAAV